MTETATYPDVTDEPEVPVAAPESGTDALPETDAPTGPAGSDEPEATSLNDFWAAVDALGDNSKAEGFSYDAVEAEYNKLNRKAKMKATHALKARTFAALDEDDFGKAKVLSGAQKIIGSTTATGGAVADPTEELVNRIAGLTLAVRKLTSDHPTLSDRVTAAIDANGEIVSALTKKLVETRMARKPRTEGGKRHNVGKHIAQVFADKAVGTFMNVAQIADAKSEEYGDDACAANTVKTHLESGKFDQAGLTVTTIDDKLGVEKVS